MYAPALPTAIKVARVLVFIGGGLAILGGLIFLLFGSAIGSNAIGGAVAVFGIVFIVLGALYIWAGFLLGKLSNGARWTVVVLAAIGLLGGLSSLGKSPGTGIVTLVLDGALIYCLAIDGAARQAFAAGRGGYAPAVPPPGYYPPPQGYNPNVGPGAQPGALGPPGGYPGAAPAGYPQQQGYQPPPPPPPGPPA